jgi:hypothetical protein
MGICVCKGACGQLERATPQNTAFSSTDTLLNWTLPSTRLIDFIWLANIIGNKPEQEAQANASLVWLN